MIILEFCCSFIAFVDTYVRVRPNSSFEYEAWFVRMKTGSFGEYLDDRCVVANESFSLNVCINVAIQKPVTKEELKYELADHKYAVECTNINVKLCDPFCLALAIISSSTYHEDHLKP